MLETLHQDSKPIEAINRKAKKPEQNDTTWVELMGKNSVGKDFLNGREKLPLYFFFCFFALLQYFVPEKMDYALYCIHYIQEIVNPQGGKENHKGKMYNVRVCLKQKYSYKRSLNWLFSWSTDTLQSQNFIFFKKSQNFRCQRSIRGKVESSRKSSMEKKKMAKVFVTLWN